MKTTALTKTSAPLLKPLIFSMALGLPLTVVADTFYFQFTNGGASATGQFTTSQSVSTDLAGAFSISNFTNVSSLDVTVAGASAGNGSFSLADFSFYFFDASGPLDYTTNLAGQANLGDFNLIGSGSPAPRGTSSFNLGADNGTGTLMTLTCFYLAGVGNLCGNASSGSGVVSSVTSLGNLPGFNAANVISGNSSLDASFTGLSSAEQSDAVSQTLPLLVAGSQLAAVNALSGINRVILARLDSNRGLSAGDTFFGDRHFWLKPFGSWANQSNDGAVAGFKANTGGMALGFDGSLSETLTAGLAFAWANSSVKGRSAVAPNNASVDVYQLVGYGTQALPNGSELNFQVDIGRNNNEGSRTLAFTNTVAQSKFNTTAFHAGVGWSKAVPLNDKTTYAPSIRLDYTRLRDEAYSETGAGLFNLNVAARTTTQLVLGGDVRFNHQLSPSTQLSVNAGLGYDFNAKTASVTAVFAGAPGASFVTSGIRPDPWMLKAGVGLVHTTQSGAEITSRLDVDKRSGFHNATASVNARWSF